MHERKDMSATQQDVAMKVSYARFIVTGQHIITDEMASERVVRDTKMTKSLFWKS